jgi:hypothetical protein
MKYFYSEKRYVSIRGFSMKSIKKIHTCVVETAILLSLVLASVVVPAETVRSDLILTQSQRNDFSEFSLILPPGCSRDFLIQNSNTVFSFDDIKGHHQQILASLSTLKIPVRFEGSDWSNAGGNAERNGLSEVKGPLSADLLWSGGRTSLISWLPVTEENQLFIVRQAGWPGATHDSTVVFMDLSTGQELWSIEIPYHTNDWTTWVGGVKNGQVYASRSGNGASVLDNLYALDAATGDTLWVSTVLIDAGPYDGVVFADDGDPIIASFTDVWRFNSKDGSLVWHADRLGSVSGSCGGALFQNRFYVADAAPGGHVLVCFDVDSGQRLYESPVMSGFTLQNTPFIGPDGTIYLSRTQNNPVTDYFYAFADTGTSLVEKWHRACAWTTFSEFAAGFDGSVYCILPGPCIGKLDSNTGDILAQSDVIDASESYLSPHFAIDVAGTVYFSNGGFSEGKASVFTTDLVPIWNTTMTNINIGGPSLGKNGILLLCGTGTNMRAYQSAQPMLDINVTTVFPRIRATITNSGEAATNLSWSLSVSGGILGRINRTSSDQVPVLDNNETLNISLKQMILGFGKITILVSAACDEGVIVSKTVGGSVFLFFVKKTT